MVPRVVCALEAPDFVVVYIWSSWWVSRYHEVCLDGVLCVHVVCLTRSEWRIAELVPSRH